MGTVTGEIAISAGGTTDFNSIGFVPSCVILLAVDAVAGNKNWSIGFDNVVGKFAIASAYNAAGNYKENTESIVIWRDDSNYQIGYISTWLSNGFRLYISQLGAVSSTLLYLCLP